MIVVQGLSKSFKDKKVFDTFSVSFKAGETTFVLGKSGVGKSVLLKHIVGLMIPDEGDISIDEVSIQNMNEIELTKVRKKCGLVFQFPALLDSLTVFDNIAFGIRAHALESEEEAIHLKVKKMLELVHLNETILEKFPAELSFGTQKRVAIARTLAIDPGYLLFDEPTTSLDPVTTQFINELIDDLKKRLGVGNIVVSHDLNSAFKIADRILLLENGRLVFDGTKVDFKNSSVPIAQDFLRESGAIC